MTLSEIRIDRDSDVPLGTQLAWRLRALVATGRLAPGERVPGVRELAEDAGVNVNTVRAVYARLEEQGLLRSEHGRGTFVAAGAAEQADLARVAAAAASAAREAGLDPRDLATALYSGADLAPAPPTRRTSRSSGQGAHPGTFEPSASADSREVRRVLRAEIAEMERELVRLDRGAELPERPRPAAGRILSAAELRGVRDTLAERLAELRDERAEARRRVYAERAAALSTPPRRASAGVWTGGKPRAGVVWSR